MLLYDLVAGVTPAGCEELGIAHRVEVAVKNVLVSGENDGGRDDGPCPCAAACFIQSGDSRIAASPQPVLLFETGLMAHG
jgi:hypothetical protein